MANTLDNVLVEHHKLGVIKFKEFLNIEPKKLSKKEYTLQKVMARLYHLNERIPPLFYTFPERPNKPLVIKADTINRCSSNNIGALYDSDDNYIQFENTGSGDNYLLNELAHELKHAEQYSEERRNLFKEKNGLICHQIDYLDEAQAYAFGDYVVALDCLEKKCSADEYIEHACSPYLIPYYKKALKEGKLDREQFEQNGILTTLHVLYSSSFDLHYRAKFDERNIINV